MLRRRACSRRADGRAHRPRTYRFPFGGVQGGPQGRQSDLREAGDRLAAFVEELAVPMYLPFSVPACQLTLMEGDSNRMERPHPTQVKSGLPRYTALSNCIELSAPRKACRPRVT